MGLHRFFGRLDQIARQLVADLVRTVINDPRKLLHRDAAERCRSRIARQNRGCEPALERPLFIHWLARRDGVVGQGKKSWSASADRRGFASRSLNPAPRPTNVQFLFHYERAGASAGDTIQASQPPLHRITVEISSRALVRVVGAWYSVLIRCGRMLGAYIRIELVRLICMDKSVIHPCVALGHRRVVYLPEHARKPLTVRQGASAT